MALIVTGSGRRVAESFESGATIAPLLVVEYGGTPPPGDPTPPTVSLTAPADDSTVSGTSVAVSATASDDVGVIGVTFYANGTRLLIEDTVPPYDIAWNSTTVANGSYALTATARDAAGTVTTSAPVTITVSNPPPPSTITLTSRVSAGSDDAEENVSSGAISRSGVLELTTTGSAVVQAVGMRFKNITIPNGTPIANATIEFEVDKVSSGTANLTFQAQAVDDALTFTATTKDISSRTKTTAAVSWNNVPAWTAVNQKHQTPNLAPLIQEVVNRPGWVSGNDIVIIVTGTGRRDAESYNSESANAPLLRVEYGG
jgi:hypothetical protein